MSSLGLSLMNWVRQRVGFGKHTDVSSFSSCKSCSRASRLVSYVTILTVSMLTPMAFAADSAKYAGKAILDTSPQVSFPDMSDGSGTRRRSLSKESATCASCHEESSPAVHLQWTRSGHYEGNIGCYECHKAEPGDEDAIRHKDYVISVIVSPKDCAQCHEKEVEQFSGSHHALAYDTSGSPDLMLAEVVEAAGHGHSAAKVSGCDQCHGSQVKVLESGQLDPLTWPNSGIGRINPDGSKGACSACHARHEFASSQARHPNTCGKCHLGEKNPIKAIYEESKHGIAFQSDIKGMNMKSSSWIVGRDYTTAPTCSTCHMSATNDLEITHDTGTRISWNNRGPVSVRPEQVGEVLGLESADTDWEERRDNMLTVCGSCHTEEYIANFYLQYDNLIHLYNNKFGIPGSQLMDVVESVLKPQQFSNKIDWIWFDLYHNEGRAARHGAAMMAPDITHWEGTYEIAKTFYNEFLPEIRNIAEKARKAGKVEEADKIIAALDEVLAQDNHQWFSPQNMQPKMQEADAEKVEGDVPTPPEQEASQPNTENVESAEDSSTSADTTDNASSDAEDKTDTHYMISMQQEAQ